MCIFSSIIKQNRFLFEKNSCSFGIKFLPFGLIAGASAGEAGLLMKLYGSCLLDETENSVDSDTVNSDTFKKIFGYGINGNVILNIFVTVIHKNVKRIKRI